MLKEGLPPTADHDWVVTKLSKYDKVNFVGLPRYPSSKDIKGFAFVEFATLAGVEECLSAIGTKEFGSVQPFPKTGCKETQRLQRSVERIGELSH